MHCCDRNGVLPWNPPVPETKWKSNFRRKMMSSSKSYSSPLLAWTGLRKTFNTNKTCKTSSVARVQIVAHQNRKSPLEINPSKKIGKKKSLKPWCLTCSNCRRGRILWSSIFQSILVPYIQLPGHFGLIDKTDKSNHSKWWFHQETNKTPAVISMAPKNSARSFWHIFRKKHLPVTGALMPTLLFGAEPSLVSIPVVITKLSRACRNTYCHETGHSNVSLSGWKK